MCVQHMFTTYGMIQPVGVVNLDYDKLLGDEAEGIRGQVEQIASEAHGKVEVQFRTGDAANEICTFVKEHHFDLIVMGSRGHGAMVELAIGSVSHKVVVHAQVPVLIVKKPACRWDDIYVFNDMGRKLSEGPSKFELIRVADRV